MGGGCGGGGWGGMGGGVGWGGVGGWVGGGVGGGGLLTHLNKEKTKTKRN